MAGTTLIGRLAVAVLGNIDDFKKNFAEGKKGVKDFNNEVKKTDMDLKKVGRNLTLVGTAIIGSMTAVTLSTLKAANAADELAKVTGETREQAQALGYAAEQEHANMESFSAGIIRLARNMYDASKGTGEAHKVFKDLNISVTDANGRLRGSTEVFLELSDKLSKLNNEAEVTGMSMKVLGRSGVELVPFLRLGREEIERLMQEAHDLGYVIDEESVIKMKELDDELVAVKAGFEGVGRQIAADTAPALLEVATGAKDALKWFHLLPDDVRKFVTQGTLAVGVIASISGGIAFLIVKIKALRIELSKTGTSLGDIAKPLLILSMAIFTWNQAKEAIKGAKIEFMKPKDIENIKDLNKALEVQTYLQKEIVRLQGVTQKYKLGNDQFYSAQIKDLQNKAEIVQKVIEKLSNPVKNPDENGSGLGDSTFDLKIVLDDLSKSLQNAETEAKTFGNTSELASKKADLLKSTIIELIKNGVNPHNTSMGDLVSQYQKYAKQAETVEAILKRQQESKDLINQATQEKINWDNRELSTLELLVAKLKTQAILDKENAAALLQHAAATRKLAEEQKAFENQKKAIDMVSEGQRKLAEMLGTIIPDWETFARQLDKAASENGVLPDTAKKLRQIAAELRDIGKAASEQERLKETLEMLEEWSKAADNVDKSDLQKQLDAIDEQENAQIKSLLGMNLSEAQSQKARADITKRWNAERVIVLKDAYDQQYEEAKKAIAKEYQLEEHLTLEKRKLRARALQDKIDELNAEGKANTAEFAALNDALEKITKESFSQSNFSDSLYNDLHGGISSAIKNGLSDGGIFGAADSFADYLKDKLRTKVADGLADALLNSTAGKSFESLFGNLFNGSASSGNANNGNVINFGGNGLSNLFKNGYSNSGGSAGIVGSAVGGAMMGGAAGGSGNGAMIGGMLGMMFGPIGAMVGGLIGGMFDGDKPDTNMTVKANSGSIIADYATANFKQVTLPSSFINQPVPSGNVVTPVTTININVTAKNILSAQKEIEKMVKDAAKAGYDEAEEAKKKWQSLTTKTV